MLIFLRPDTQLPPLGVLSALGSSLFYASALIMSRGLADKDGVLSTVASASVITAIFSLILVQGHFVMPTGWVIWGWLVLVIIVGVMRQFCDIQAYRFGEAAVIAPRFPICGWFSLGLLGIFCLPRCQAWQRFWGR